MAGLRRLLPLVAPSVLVLVAAAAPLMLGTRSLFLRDVASVHLPMKAAQDAAFEEGRFPLLDLGRAGGQPLAGNPNAVPFYPDNLLYLFAPFLWAFNAHFWLHLLLAPWAGYWLGRAWGLGRAPAWAVGVCFVGSGFFLSQLSFFNLVAGTALTPALVAACLDTAGRKPRRAAAVALLWGLILLGGDPLLAGQAGLLAAAAVVLREGRGTLRSLPRMLAAVLAGTLLAAPQLVEFLRVLPVSYRGFHGYRGVGATVDSWDPRQVVEWFLPFFFGRPDLVGPGRFWGYRFFTGTPPFFFSLYPGLLAMVLLGISGRPTRRQGGTWAWGAVAVGLFLALGRFNPLLAPILEGGYLPVVRYPVKLWLPVAVGASLLGGLGLERLLAGRARHLRALVAALAGAYAAAWIGLMLFGESIESALATVLPASLPAVAFAANERLRWAGLCLLSLLVLGALALALRSVTARRRGAVPWLLAGHLAVQLLLLRPLAVSESAAQMLAEPALLGELPSEETVVHGAFAQAIAPSTLERGPFPSNDVRWLLRRAQAEAYPFAGRMHGRRYELDLSPEGLDSFLTRAARDALKVVGDRERVRLLRAWGVGRLVLHRALDPEVGDEVRLLRRLETRGHPAWLYEIRDPAPEVAVLGRVRWASRPTDALAILSSASFDPRETAVLAGEGPPVDGAGGEVLDVRRRGEELEVELRCDSPGVLVIQRAHLPVYLASVDGREVPLRIAGLHRIGIELPAGARRVWLRVDRRPLYGAAVASFVGLIGLILLGRRRPEPVL